MLFNGSGIPRPIFRDGHFSTIEFKTTTRPTEPYRAQYQLQNRLEQIMGEGAIGGPGGNIIENMNSRIANVQRDIGEIRGSNRNTILAVGGMVLAAAAIPGAILLTMLWDRVKSAEEIVNRMKDHQQQVVEAIQTEGEQQRLEIQNASLLAKNQAVLELRKAADEAQERAIHAIQTWQPPAPGPGP